MNEVAFCSSNERQQIQTNSDMSDTWREIVSGLAAKNSQQKEAEDVLISLDIEDDKLFLLHFIIGTYFGPALKPQNHGKQSAFQIQASKKNFAANELSGSLMKRVEIERVYNHILSNADSSLIVKPKLLRKFLIGKRNDCDIDFPLFADLYPRTLHPEIRLGNKYKFIRSIVFISDPDTSCIRQDCLERFKRLTKLESFTLSLSVDVTETNDIVVVDNEVDESLKEDTCLEVDIPCVGDDNVGACVIGEGSMKTGPLSEPQGGLMVGLMDIGDCDDAYLFRVSLPGVSRDERDFSCEVEDSGKVLVRGVTTTGEKRVHRFSHVFEMQTQNLCPPGDFSVSFHLPGPVHPEEFSGNFGTDGIFEGIVMKKLQKQTVLWKQNLY